jgi:hypothetical protein
MVIQIDPKKIERLQAIAKATGRTLDQVVDTALDCLIREQATRPADDLMSDEEHAAMLARIDEIRNLPEEGPDDDFSVEDHDKVIYRIDW